jgi:hypothetical protein
MKKKILESEYTTIRVHKKTAKKLESLKMRNYDEAISKVIELSSIEFSGGKNEKQTKRK